MAMGISAAEEDREGSYFEKKIEPVHWQARPPPSVGRFFLSYFYVYVSLICALFAITLPFAYKVIYWSPLFIPDSEMTSWHLYILAPASVLILTKIFLLFASSQKAKLPPSPPAEPFLGHARKIPTKEPYRTYAEWGKLYGDVVSATAPGTTLIIMNTYQAARELLEKNSVHFSERPYLPLFDLMGWGDTAPFLQYGPHLRTHRRMMQKYLNVQGAAASEHLIVAQNMQIRRFLKQLVTEPETFREAMHVLVTGTIINVVYGHKVTSNNDAHLKVVDRAVRLVGEIGSIGATIIDLVPILRYIPAWLPGMGLKRHALKTRDVVDQIIEGPFNEAKTRKLAGETSPSMVSDLLHDKEDTTDEEHEKTLKKVAFAVFNAGADSTGTVLATFFMMMVLHPEVMARAQAEVDLIIGSKPERLIGLDDRGKLPYVECILKELYRINPPAPLGIPHVSSQDVHFREWVIPCGSLGIANMWAMARDERFFPEPEVFRPERYETCSTISRDENGSIQACHDADPSMIVFGFGRRACPGKLFADSILFLAIANVLTTFNILPYVNPENGKKEMPEFEFEFGIISKPKAYKCGIVPRGPWHVQLVKELSVE